MNPTQIEPPAGNALPPPAPASVREYKSLAFKTGDTTGLEDDQFQGYLSTFGSIDEGGDAIAQGAFTATLPDFLANGVVCWQHDWMTPIGKWLAAHEDPYGLFVKAKVSQTTAGKDALILLRDNVIKKMSIGYEVEGYRMLSDDEGIAMFGQAAYDAAMRNMPWYQDGVRLLTQIKLYEGSPVTVPMNPKAVITGVKDGGALAALAHDAHFAAVHAAVGEYLIRVKGIADLRRKAGRVLSAANASKLQTMRDSLADHMSMLDDMLAANNPSDDPDDDGDSDPAGGDDSAKAALVAIHYEMLRFQRTLATSMNGVS